MSEPTIKGTPFGRWPTHANIPLGWIIETAAELLVQGYTDAALEVLTLCRRALHEEQLALLRGQADG